MKSIDLLYLTVSGIIMPRLYNLNMPKLLISTISYERTYGSTLIVEKLCLKKYDSNKELNNDNIKIRYCLPQPQEVRHKLLMQTSTLFTTFNYILRCFEGTSFFCDVFKGYILAVPNKS